MRRALNAGNQFVIQPFDPVQDVGVTLFLLRLHALAEKACRVEALAKTDRLFIQNNAFNLRAAEVYADAVF
jgi:hypothetical protein